MINNKKWYVIFANSKTIKNMWCDICHLSDFFYKDIKKMKKIIVDLLSKSLFYDHHIHHIHIFIQLGKRLKSSEIDFFYSYNFIFINEWWILMHLNIGIFLSFFGFFFLIQIEYCNNVILDLRLFKIHS